MQRLVMRAGAKEIGEEEDGGAGHVGSGAKMNEKTVAVLNKVREEMDGDARGSDGAVVFRGRREF